MKRSDALKRLAALKPELDGLGIKSLAVFGSVARDRARTGSDIDLLVEFHRTPDLIEFAGVKLRLEELLGCRVDLVTRGGMHPLLHRRILKEARDGDIAIRRPAAGARKSAMVAAEEIIEERQHHRLDRKAMNRLVAEGRRG